MKQMLSSITALFGTVQIAANGVAQSFWSVAALMGTSLGLAFVTVIGQCMGAGDPGEFIPLPDLERRVLEEIAGTLSGGGKEVELWR